MRLYLMRHGEAEFGPNDDERPLTDEGQESVEHAAKALARLSPGIHRVWHSGKRRAKETAEIVAARLEPTLPLTVIAGLGPEDDPEAISEALLAERTPTLVVGHLPQLARLAALLVTGDPDRALVRMPPSTIVHLADEDGPWRIFWVLPPETTSSRSSSPGH